ncbi:hypothetical protein ADUPG1_010174, partial [Aduncisulcus paluster]
SKTPPVDTVHIPVLIKKFIILSEGVDSRKYYMKILQRYLLADKLHCPYLIPLLTSFRELHITQFNKQFGVFVMPFYEKGDLSMWITSPNIKPSDLFHVLICVLKGLEALISKGLVHCDIKPQNILIDDAGNGILCDFEGIVDNMGKNLRKTMDLICFLYVASELKVTENPHPTHKSDMYSFGAMLKKDIKEYFWKYLHRPYPQILHDIEVKCCDDNPANRPDAHDVLEWICSDIGFREKRYDKFDDESSDKKEDKCDEVSAETEEEKMEEDE